MPRLDWRSEHDPRSRLFGIGGGVPPRRSVLWRPGEFLDQGVEGACVGFAWVADALASPVRVKLLDTTHAYAETADNLARMVYRQAQHEDQWASTPPEEGTSVIAGAKIMQKLGFIKQYRWSFHVDDLRYAVLTHGPAVLGIPWLTGMWTPDPTGVLHATGSVAGGHAILCNGYQPGLGFHLQNSWGPGWGRNGGAWIPEPDLAHLLSMDGEACVPVGRSYNRRKREPVSG